MIAAGLSFSLPRRRRRRDKDNLYLKGLASVLEISPRCVVELCLNELMLDSKAGGGTAGRDLNFAINVSHVGIDGARAHNKLFGDLFIGESLCQQTQHFNFTGF